MLNSSHFTSGLQVLALLVLGLLAGSIFGIWRGYDVTQYSPSTLVEVHQGAVRGLNALLPAMGLVSIVLALCLAVIARGQPLALGLLIVTIVLVAVAGLVTRFGNQPINDQMMSWSPASLPADWQSIRNSWWSFHVMRLGATTAAFVTLIVAILAQRG